MNIGEKFYCSECMREIEREGIYPHCGYDQNQSVSRNALEEGTVLHAGRYQLGAVIGRGGFGITYAAWDYTLSQPVAVKEYFPQSIKKVVAVLDWFEDNNTSYIVMEYVRGITLERYVQQHKVEPQRLIGADNDKIRERSSRPIKNKSYVLGEWL